MSLMIDALLILVVIVFPNLALSPTENDVSQSGFFNIGNDDQIFSDNIIMEVAARSRLACASICKATLECDAYTHVKGSPVTSSVECRLYSGFLAAGSSSLMGARTFAMDKSDVDECTSNPCQNGGTCTDELNGYLCQCAPGYAGLQCQTDVDECSSNPCQNGGTCIDQVNGYLCLCAPGYAGLQCQTNIDECSSSPCQNGGTCTDQVNGYLCQCAPGYAGLQCQTDVDECSSNPCQNGGTCTDQVNGYLCQCAPGYAGLQCQTDVDECSSNPCQNGGTCTDQVNGYLCKCAPGYAGLQCQTDVDECSSNPCQNGGTCTDQINGYLCQCAPGYAGLQYQTDVDECSSSPCQNGGTRTDQVNGYLCQCAPGYAGPLCQTDVDECSSNPCQNGGTCTDQINGYLCQCAPGDEGLQCQTAWLKKTCTNDADCPGSLVTCHVGQCLCQPAAYYSNGANVCVQSCGQSDLRSTFLAYTGTDIDYDHYPHRYIDLGSVIDDLGLCQQNCVIYNGCHAIVHAPGGDADEVESCWPVYAFETGATINAEPWITYKRTCA